MLMKHSAPSWQAASTLSPESRISFNSRWGMLFPPCQVYSRAPGFGSRARGHRERQQHEEVHGALWSWSPPPWRAWAGVCSDHEQMHRSSVRTENIPSVTEGLELLLSKQLVSLLGSEAGTNNFTQIPGPIMVLESQREQKAFFSSSDLGAC